MKLTEKFVLAMALVVTLAVSVGGTILLAVQFQASFQNAVAQDSSRHTLARYSLESKVLADRLKGVAFSKANLAKYADQLCSYTADERMRVTDADGQVVFSNLTGSPVLAEDSYQVCRTGEQYLLYFQSATSVGGNRFRLVSASTSPTCTGSASGSFGSFWPSKGWCWRAPCWRRGASPVPSPNPCGCWDR